MGPMGRRRGGTLSGRVYLIGWSRRWLYGRGGSLFNRRARAMVEAGHPAASRMRAFRANRACEPRSAG